MARRTWLFTLCMWLSLATVLAHALAPISSPLTQKSGSAFSASTSDVSLRSTRAGIIAKLKRAPSAPDDEGGPPAAPAALIAAAPATPQPATRPAFRAASPSFDAPGFDPGGAFDARAPPRA